MKVVIIEDETAAAQNLKSMLADMFPQMTVLATIESVVDAVEWFENNATPELVFMDIHLADGNAFMIFDRVSVTCPVIFTTAYDQYALEAFKVNSIDYILKPIKEDELQRAVGKLAHLSRSEIKDYTRKVSEMAQRQTRRTTILVHVRDRIVPLKISDVAFCYTSNEKVVAYTNDNTQYTLDGSLESVATMMPDSRFFRANRQFVISRDAIKDISIWFGSRLSVNLNIPQPEKIIISKARVAEFKRWLTGASEE